jgi:glycosyltransferase involved in cell wall biosynthesis
MTVLRITRTYPNVKYKSIGLQTYMFAKYYHARSIIFSKKSVHKALQQKKVDLYESYYPEISLDSGFFFQKYISIILKIIGNLIFLKKIFFYVNFKNISFIHIHNLNFLLTGILLKKIFKKKIFLSIGGTDIKRLKNKKLFLYLINNVDLVFSVSLNLKKQFNSLYPNITCRYIGNGVDLNKYKFKKNNIKKNIIAIGNIRWQKDYATLIQAFSKSKIKSKYKLLICGGILEKREYQKIKKIVKERRLEKKIIFKGFCSQKKILNLLQNSKVLALSSISEGLPKVILEAMACHIPVVSTNVGDNATILKKTGLISPKKNIHQFSKNLDKMCNNKILYQQLVKNCNSEKTKYSWENISKNAFKYY